MPPRGPVGPVDPVDPVPGPVGPVAPSCPRCPRFPRLQQSAQLQPAPQMIPMTGMLNAKIFRRSGQEKRQRPQAHRHLARIPRYTLQMSGGITVPFKHLVFFHREIGIHRGRRAGFAEVFRYQTLHDLPFTRLAGKVKDAYEGRHVPDHDGWPDQREALRWLIDKGRDGIYALDSKGIKVRPCPWQHYYIADGHHRALALYVLGDSEIRARVRYS